MAPAALVRQAVPLWLTSICQMEGCGMFGSKPALRTAPTRARELLALAMRGPAACAGLKAPGPRKLRVPPALSKTIVSFACSLICALSGSERPGGYCAAEGPDERTTSTLAAAGVAAMARRARSPRRRADALL